MKEVRHDFYQPGMWREGDVVGLLLDLEKRSLSYFVNGKVGQRDAFIDLPVGEYHFYFSGGNGDEVEIIQQKLHLTDESLLMEKN